MTSLDELDLFSKPSSTFIVPAPSRHGVTATPPDPARQRRNRNNRKRGKSTSSELAKYLDAQNVEGLNWSWDLQARAFRIQSKRDKLARSAASVRALIVGIPAGDYLRAVYIVKPRQRLAAGEVTLLLEEWIAERGWKLPPTAALVNAGDPLIRMPLSDFRDLVVGETPRDEVTPDWPVDHAEGKE